MPLWDKAISIWLNNSQLNCIPGEIAMSDFELIATDAPMIKVKQVREKKIKDKRRNFDARQKVQNINPRRK
jgi:hypothetical protein